MLDSPQSDAKPSVVANPRRVRRETRKVLRLQIARQVVAMGGAIALYRLLGPEPFGLFGMVIPLLMLPRLPAKAMRMAAVQAEKISGNQRSAVFYLTVLLGVGAALLTGGLGHLFSRIYQAPELVWVSWAFAGTTLAESFGFTHLACLQRELKLGKIAVIRLVSQIAAVTAAVLAAVQLQADVLELGVWALIAMEYVQLSMNTLGYWYSGRWRPGCSVKTEIKHLLRFGGNYSLSRLIFYTGQNMDKVLLAFVLGGTQTGQRLLGMYTAMYNLMMKPVDVVTDPVTSVMLPALSRARNNPKDYSRIAIGFYQFTAILLIPAGVGLSVLSADVVSLVNGPDWNEAAVMLLALAPTICVHGLINISGSLLASIGQTGRLLAAASMLFLIQALGYATAYWFASQFEFGPDVSIHDAFSVGVAVSYTVVLWVFTVPYLVFCFSRVEVAIGSLLLEFGQILGRSMLMGITVWLLQDLMVSNGWSLYFRLPLAILAGGLAYSVLMWSRIQQSVLPFFKRGREVQA
ncbi:MAG: hypothetical protein CMJ82_12130 [Planctomycetaceae bacterium]|nr:hypothetical protein [Planctomycetaceae bacterium]